MLHKQPPRANQLRGEVLAILPQVRVNVHGASLKRSELISRNSCFLGKNHETWDTTHAGKSSGPGGATSGRKSDIIHSFTWHSLQERSWAPTTSNPCSVLEVWARFIGRATRGSAALWPSRFCLRPSRRMRTGCSASCRKLARPRH